MFFRIVKFLLQAKKDVIQLMIMFSVSSAIEYTREQRLVNIDQGYLLMDRFSALIFLALVKACCLKTNALVLVFTPFVLFFCIIFVIFIGVKDSL